MINVMVVDDHNLVRKGLSVMLSSAQGIRVTGEACSGEEALTLAKSKRPDVILMDLKMPGIGGIEATKKLSRMLPEAKIVIVTVCDDDLFPSRVLQAGAVGYITKGAELEEMLRAIKSVHSGQRYISPEIARLLALRHLDDTGKSPFEVLSERELQVFMMITQGAKVQDIADKLCLSSKTVNSYRYRIFEKLGVKNDVELTHLAIKHGVIELVDQETS